MYNNNSTLCVLRDSGGGGYSHVTVHQSRRSLSGAAAAGYKRFALFARTLSPIPAGICAVSAGGTLTLSLRRTYTHTHRHMRVCKNHSRSSKHIHTQTHIHVYYIIIMIHYVIIYYDVYCCGIVVGHYSKVPVLDVDNKI